MKNISVIVFLLIASSGYACSCINAGDFCTVVDATKDHPDALIVIGEAGNQDAHGVDFKIDEVLYGSESRKRIKIWGDPGYLCRTYTSNFEKGKSYVMVLSRIQQDRVESYNDVKESAGEYVISVCGQFWLPLKDFDKEVKDCVAYSTKAKEISDLSIYPTLATDQISIPREEFRGKGLGSVNIYSMNGQRLGTRITIDFDSYIGGPARVDTSFLPSGVYVVELIVDNRKYVSKFVKM